MRSARRKRSERTESLGMGIESVETNKKYFMTIKRSALARQALAKDALKQIANNFIMNATSTFSCSFCWLLSRRLLSVRYTLSRCVWFCECGRKKTMREASLSCHLSYTDLPSKGSESFRKTSKKWWKTSFFRLLSPLCQNFCVVY